MERVPEGELDLEDLDGGQMAGDVAEEERGDAHHAEVEPADGHAARGDLGQVAVRDELVSDQTEEADGTARQGPRRCDGRPPKDLEGGQGPWRQVERLVAVEQVQMLDRRIVPQEPCNRRARAIVQLWRERPPPQAAQREDPQGREGAAVKNGARVEGSANEPKGKIELLEVEEGLKGAVEDVEDGRDGGDVLFAVAWIGLPSDGEFADDLGEVAAGEDGARASACAPWAGRGAR